MQRVISAIFCTSETAVVTSGSSHGGLTNTTHRSPLGRSAPHTVTVTATSSHRPLVVPSSGSVPDFGRASHIAQQDNSGDLASAASSSSSLRSWEHSGRPRSHTAPSPTFPQDSQSVKQPQFPREPQKFVDVIDRVADTLVANLGGNGSSTSRQANIAMQRVKSRIARSNKLQIFLYLLKLGVRNALSAYAIQVATSLISAAVKGRNLKEFLLSLIDRSYFRFAMFAGCCSGFTATLRVLSIMIGGKDGRITATIAGLLGGLTILIDKKSQTYAFPLYFLVRACYAGVHTLMRTGYVRSTKKLPYLLYGFSSAVIGYAFILEPHLVDKSYARWIRTLAGIEKPVLEWLAKEPYYGVTDKMVNGLYLLASAVGTNDLSWIDGHLPEEWQNSKRVPGSVAGVLSKKGIYVEGPAEDSWAVGLNPENVERLPPAFQSFVKQQADDIGEDKKAWLEKNMSTVFRQCFQSARRLFTPSTLQAISEPELDATSNTSLFTDNVAQRKCDASERGRFTNGLNETMSIVSAYKRAQFSDLSEDKKLYLYKLTCKLKDWWQTMLHSSSEKQETVSKVLDAIELALSVKGEHQCVHPEQPEYVITPLRTLEPANLFPGVPIGEQFFRSCTHMWHQGHSCLGHHILQIPRQIIFGIRVYLPVHLVPQLLFRSCAYLVTHGFVMMSLFCFLRQWLRKDTWYSTALSCASGALGLYFEAPKRVTELSLYALPRALEILFQLGEKHALLYRIPHGNVLMFCLANALFIGIPREDFKATYRSILDFFYGDNQFFAGLVQAPPADNSTASGL